MKPGPSLEKALYVGCLAAMGITGVAVAVLGLLGQFRLVVALLGLGAVVASVLIPVHARRMRRFMGVATRRAGGRGRAAAPTTSPGPAASVEVGRETMAALTRINRQLVSLREETMGRQLRPVSGAGPTDVADDRSDSSIAVAEALVGVCHELSVLRAEVAHLAEAPRGGRQA